MKTILSIAALSSLLFASVGCDAGLTLRPKAPSFAAHAEFGGGSQAAPAPMATSVVAAEPVAYAPDSASAGVAPAGIAPTSGYQQSGGADAATASVVAAGNQILGRVSKGAPRYFALDLAVGDSLAFKVYGRKLQDSGSFYVRLLEPDNVALADTTLHIYAPTTEFERKSMNATAKQAGRHILKVYSSQPVEFRIDISAVNVSGM